MMGNKAMNASWPIIIQLCNETSSCCRGNWFWRIDDERYFFCADAELIGNVSLGEKENRRMRCRNVCNCKNLLRYFHPGCDTSTLEATIPAWIACTLRNSETCSRMCSQIPRTPVRWFHLSPRGEIADIARLTPFTHKSSQMLWRETEDLPRCRKVRTIVAPLSAWLNRGEG